MDWQKNKDLLIKYNKGLVKISSFLSEYVQTKDLHEVDFEIEAMLCDLLYDILEGYEEEIIEKCNKILSMSDREKMIEIIKNPENLKYIVNPADKFIQSKNISRL